MSEPSVYFDSCCFIDMVSTAIGEGDKDRAESVWYYKKLIQASKDGAINVYTSYLTITECLHVKNNENNKRIITDEVKRLFNSIIISGRSGVIPIMPTREIMRGARDLCWEHGVILEPFDSIHIACALDVGCSEFVTTDRNSINKKSADNLNKLKAMGLSIIYANETTSLPDKYRQTELSER